MPPPSKLAVFRVEVLKGSGREGSLVMGRRGDVIYYHIRELT